MKKSIEPLVIDRSAMKLNWAHSLAVALIGVTLAVVPFYATRYVFAGMMFQKAMLFYVLVNLLILVYLWLIYHDRQYLPKFSLVGWLFSLLIVGWAISTLTSQQPYLSFWGSFNRMEGLISWIYYFTFFVVITGVLKRPADWWQAIRFALVGVALVVVYALGQILRVRLFVPSADPFRVESTLGNPVFLGGYLASALPLLLAWVLSLRSPRWRNLGWLFFGLATLVFILTLSRGAWIAGLVAIPLIFTLYLYRYQPHQVKRMLITVGIAAGLFAIFAVVWRMSPSESWVRQMGDKTVFRSASLLYRRWSWATGLRAFGEKPIFGWGLENFHLAFDRNYQALPRHVGFTESHVDRAHNEYIGVAVSGGLPALIPYLLLLGLALYRGWRYARSQERSDSYLINIGLLGAIVGYAVFVFTAFNLITNILFLLFALAWMNQISTGRSTSSAARRVPRLILVMVALIALGGAYFTIVSPVWAVRLADQGTIEFRSRSNFNKALPLFQQALAKNSFMSNVIRAQMSVISAANAVVLTMDDPDLTKFQAYTGEVLRQNFITEPYTSYSHMIVGMFYGSLAKKFPDYMNTADQLFQETVDLAPGKGESWLRWGEMYAGLDNWPKAKEKLDKAMEVDPYNSDIMFIAGIQYMAFGETERGDALVKQAIKAGHPASFAEVKQIGDALVKSGRLDRAEVLYQQIIDDPQNDQETVFAIVELTDIYRREGRWNDAEGLAQELFKYEVDEGQRDQLIKDVNAKIAPPPIS